jgi:hypothetical protein
MEKQPLQILLSHPAFDWIQRYARIRKIDDLSLAFESLINKVRAETEGFDFAEPHGQALVRDALARCGALTVAGLVRETGLSTVTARQYARKLEALGHAKGGKFEKTATNFAEAIELTIAGRRIWISRIKDPEERAIQEMNAADLENKT